MRIRQEKGNTAFIQLNLEKNSQNKFIFLKSVNEQQQKKKCIQTQNII